MIERLWMILYGLAHIATGLVLVLSLGAYSPRLHEKTSMAMARYRMRRSLK